MCAEYDAAIVFTVLFAVMFTGIVVTIALGVYKNCNDWYNRVK